MLRSRSGRLPVGLIIVILIAGMTGCGSCRQGKGKVVASEPDGPSADAGKDREAGGETPESRTPGTLLRSAGGARIVEPRVVWTGDGFVVVWMEVAGDQELPGYEADVWSMDGVGFKAWVASLDKNGALLSEPVTIEGLGEPGKGARGPYIAYPVWKDDSLYLAWMTCEERPREPGEPYLSDCTYMLGRWHGDGRNVLAPVVLGKGVHSDDWHGITLTSVEKGLYVSWESNEPRKVTRCPRSQCGDPESVKSVRVALDGTVEETLYACGEVVSGFQGHAFGQGLVYVIRDEHMVESKIVRCSEKVKGCGKTYREYPNSQGMWFDVIGMTRAGLAFEYSSAWDEEKVEVTERCVDILYPPGQGKPIACIKPTNADYVWKSGGLRVDIDEGEGRVHSIQLKPGDHVERQVLEGVTGERLVFSDAVWTGGSIGVTWSREEEVHFRLFEREDDAVEEPPTAARPIFAEPEDNEPSRSVPHALYHWSGRGEEEESAAEDAFHESVREEVEALVAEAAAGKPRLITLRVGTTLGWGCGCPWFVIPYKVGSAVYDDEFIIHLLADGIPEIDYKVFGYFQMIGHYTGRRLDTGPDSDKIGTHAYPEFHVHSWCYVPPASPLTWEHEAPEMQEMRAAGAPLCKGKHWPKWIEQPPVSP